MVNNGSWDIYAPCGVQSGWSGPPTSSHRFFMFIAEFPHTLQIRFEFSHAASMKILKRTIIISLPGMAIGWFSRSAGHWASAPDGLSFGKYKASVWTFDRIVFWVSATTAGPLLRSSLHRALT